MAQVSYGTITITDTNDIERIYPVYCRGGASSAPSLLPLSNWKENISEITVTGDYIWQRIVTKKSGVTVTQNDYGDAVRLTGEEGDAGRGLTNTTTQYCNYGAGEPPNNYIGWADAPPSYDSSKPNYWVKITNTYSATPTSEIIKYKDEALTKAVADAAIANSISQSAEENSFGALSIARATEQHYWFNPTTEGTLLSGAYITDTAIDTFKQSRTGGYLLARSDGVILGKNTQKYMELSGTSLSFYKDGTNAAATLSSSGLNIVEGAIQFSTGGAAGTEDGNVRLANVDFTRSILGSNRSALRLAIGGKFGVDKAGNLYAANATISGAITATSLDLTTNNVKIETDSINGLKTVATTGSYNDLTDKPTIPSLTGYIYVNGQIGSTPAEGATGFVVATGGLLKASNAMIFGSIYASAGYIGGWQIGTDGNKTLHNGSANTSPTIGNNTIILSKGLTSSVSVAGSSGSKTWAFVSGTNFGVTTSGNLYANEAHISGTLTAGANSTIGPWTVTATSIYKGNASHSASGAGNMYFGDNGLSISNKFTVDNTGILHATGAVIEGTVTVTADSNLSAGLGNYSTIEDLSGLLAGKQDAGDYLTSSDYDQRISSIAQLIDTLNGQIVFGDDGTNTFILLQNHKKNDKTSLSGIQTKLTAGKLAFGTFGSVDNEVAYFTEQELRVQKKVSFGNFDMKQRDNGHFSIIRKG